jgi:orotate phosphoribosyltransferase
MRMNAKYKGRMHQPDFIRLCIELGVLRFGDFRLKSGRVSPYFFNAGLFNTGRAIAAIGRYYARAAALSGLAFDMLFGPAYKGIPLVTATAAAFALNESRDLPFAFNRKETKDHGEGGTLIGAPLAGRVLIVDDVITAGTAIRESVQLIRGQGATPVGVLIALDREERGQGERSAVQEAQDELGLPVVTVLRLRDLMTHLEANGETAILASIRAYRDRYGV